MSTESSSHSVTCLLDAMAAGDTNAQDRLMDAVYADLRRLADVQMADEAPERTRQSTELVHDAYQRLFGKGPVRFQSRRHFFNTAARAMRRILVDDARRRNARKRRPAGKRIPLSDAEAAAASEPEEVLEVDSALDELEKEDARMARIVEWRYYAGLTVEVTAEAMDLSPRMVQLLMCSARARLERILSERGDPPC